jgi:hypothetical protein
VERTILATEAQIIWLRRELVSMIADDTLLLRRTDVNLSPAMHGDLQEHIYAAAQWLAVLSELQPESANRIATGMIHSASERLREWNNALGQSGALDANHPYPAPSPRCIHNKLFTEECAHCNAGAGEIDAANAKQDAADRKVDGNGTGGG